ncbi:MAG TPA: hypothetical protein VFX37_05990, partial [Pseudolabrys sp.]|nr:hypothetical protein [Pseudolabrys sp.]
APDDNAVVKRTKFHVCPPGILKELCFSVAGRTPRQYLAARWVAKFLAARGVRKIFSTHFD